MKYQLWHSSSARSGLLLAEDDKWSPRAPDAQVIWSVEANTYDEARQKRDEFLERAGFTFASYSDPEAVQELQELIMSDAHEPGRHRSERSVSSEKTTRATSIVYVDGDGNEQSFEVPGWIGITTKLAAHVEDIVAHLVEAGANDIATLKQIYVERPYRDLPPVPDELMTVVVLRNESGMGMLQEFAGRIDDHALLGALVSRRLGQDIVDWKFVEVSLMKRVPDDGVTSPSPPLEHWREGVLHIIYTAHGSDADFQKIEADLNHVAKECPHLVLVMEDVLATEPIRQRLDPTLRNLPPEVLFASRTTRRNKEEFARAYASAVRTSEGAYRAWNEAPAARKQTIFGEVSPFYGRLLAWAAAHHVEIIRGETSLEAWLTFAAGLSTSLLADAAAARGDHATLWAEHRRECELVSRERELRDADTNAQITRVLQAERRGHDVLHVVGVLHSVDEDLLVRGLKAVVHEKRFPESIGERWIEALAKNTVDDQPNAVRERLETLDFLHRRLQTLAPWTMSMDDIAHIIDEIEQEAAARNITLREIVDDMIATSDFQEVASDLDHAILRRFIARAFLTYAINGGFILRTEVEKYVYLPTS